MALGGERDTLVGMDSSALLSLLSQRAAARLSADEHAQAYLRGQGVADEQVWARYRLGATGKELLAAFSDEEREGLVALGLHRHPCVSHLSSTGILIPTFDPHQPEVPVGFAKIGYGQSKHGVIGSPCGIACTTDIADCTKVIITDNPLLMLRLAVLGAKNVVLAEEAEVLDRYADWLREREVIVASYKRRVLAAREEHLKGIGIEPETVIVTADIARLPEDGVAILGIQRPAPAKRLQRDVPPRLVRELAEFAAQRIADGHGAEALKVLGVADPAMVSALGLGFLPKDFAKSLSMTHRRIMRGKTIGGSIVFPALDEQGVPVDLVSVRRQGRHTRHVNLLDEPLGLPCARVARAYKEIVVVESLMVVARLWGLGLRNAIVLRGEADAKNNAQRLRDSGVRKALLALWAKKSAPAFAASLSAGGIETTFAVLPKSLDRITTDWLDRALAMEVKAPVEAAPCAKTHVPPVPAPLPSPVADAPPHIKEAAEDMPDVQEGIPEYPEHPELVGHDERLLRATFKANDVVYEVETALDVGRQLKVVLKRQAQHHGDRIDMAKAMQRRRFAESSALKLKVPFEAVISHLEHIEREVERIQDAMRNPGVSAAPATVAMTDDERKAATAFLRSPNLLERIAEDLEAMGLVGERDNALLLYLTATSRKMPFTPPQTPLSAALVSASGSGKTHSLDSVCALMPPEDILHASRLSDTSLYHFDPTALLNKVLLVPEADALTQDVAVALRVLLSSGGLTHSQVNRDPVTGRSRTQTVEVKAAVSLLTSTTGGLDEQVASRCVEARVDESKEQTERIVAAQMRLRADREFWGQGGEREKILQRHHAAQRLIESRPVLIPFAQRIAFPSFRVAHRRMAEKFLNAIAASALLHQYQRPRDGEFVVATEADFDLARKLLAPQVERASTDISAHAQDVVAVLKETGMTEFTAADLRAHRPDWDRYRVRAGLEELLRLEVLASPKRTRPRRYEVVEDGAVRIGEGQVRLMAKSGSGGVANTSAVRATG